MIKLQIFQIKKIMKFKLLQILFKINGRCLTKKIGIRNNFYFVRLKKILKINRLKSHKIKIKVNNIIIHK